MRVQWRLSLRRFGLRFIICLVILGGLYLITFGQNFKSHNKPSTSSQKIAGLRAALDESYLTGNSLAAFRQNDPATYVALSYAFSQYQLAYANLQTALKTAPPTVTPEMQTLVRAILAQEKQAINTYNVVYSALLHPIAYDPSTDLGGLDATKATAQLAQRAAAAQKGLKKAATNQTVAPVNTSGLVVQGENTPTSLIYSSTEQALLKAASCFGQVTTQLNAHQLSQAVTTRNTCIDSYPAARLIAIQNVTQTAFSPAYQQFMKAKVPSLLKQLDKLITPPKAA